jgi:hypothetical protein
MTVTLETKQKRLNRKLCDEVIPETVSGNHSACV